VKLVLRGSAWFIFPSRGKPSVHAHPVAYRDSGRGHDGDGGHDDPRQDPDVPEPLPHRGPFLEEVRELRVHPVSRRRRCNGTRGWLTSTSLIVEAHCMLYPTKCATLLNSATCPPGPVGTTHKALERCHDSPQKKKKKNTTH
jgi:hypothetical protein